MQQGMDKSWIYTSLPFDGAYIVGVDQFMQHVRSRFGATEKIKCPCCHCLNRKENSQVDVEEDININDFIGAIQGGFTREREMMMNKMMMAHCLLLVLKICYGMEMTRPHLEMTSHHMHGDEGLAQDVIEDSARGVQGLVQYLYTIARHGFGGNLYKQIMEEAKCELYLGCTEESWLSFTIKLPHIKCTIR